MGLLRDVAPIVGGLLGGGLDALGQSSANKANRKLAREQRDWEEMMANTAVQRRMADMKAAGVNPLLGVGEGQGAAVPNVAPARVESISKGNAGVAAHSAQQAALIASEIRSKNAGAANLEATTSQIIPKQAEEIIARIDSVKAGTKLSGEQSIKTHIEGEIKNWDLTVLVNTAAALVSKIKSEAAEAAANVPGAEARAEMYKTAFGVIVPYMEKLLPLINSAGAAGAGAAVMKAIQPKGKRVPKGHGTFDKKTGEIFDK